MKRQRSQSEPSVFTGSEFRDDASGRASGWTGKVTSAPVALRLLLVVALLAAVAVLDIATGSEVSFSIFYLVPVYVAGSLISRRAGIVFAVFCAATWGYLEVSTGRPYSAAWIPYWNTLVRLGFFVLVNELLERLRLSHAKQRALARRDSLTGIANTRVFAEYTERAIAVSRRNGRPFTIAYIDLDRFKSVNDDMGHSEGDRLLRAVAALIASRARSTDVVARLGGDEFGILMPDTGAEQARVSLERIADSLAGEVGGRWPVGATIGAVTFVETLGDVDSAMRETDTLMYRGKAEGRGRIVQGVWPEPVAD